jgi:hypothetical protein
MGKPPILNFGCSRTHANQEKPFYYDSALHLNLIEIDGSTMPFVDIPAILTPELHTKTEADRESDDEGSRLLELLTKTFAQRESDDQ